MNKKNSLTLSSDLSQKSSKGIRWWVLPPLIIAIGLLQGVFLFKFSENQKLYIDSNQKVMAQKTGELMQEELQRNTNTMGAALDSIVRDSQLAEAFAAKDTEALMLRSKPLYDRLNDRYQITHFYFHQTNRINLLRIHKNLRGDLIDRLTLKQAEQTGQPSSGLEQGPTGNPVLRVVYPWYSDLAERTDSHWFEPFTHGNLLGYVELGIEFEDIAKRISKILDIELIIAVDKKFLKQEQWEQRNQKMGRQSAWNDFPDMVAIDRSIPEIPTPIRQALSQPNGSINSDFTFSEKGKTIQVIFQPLIDLNGRKLGYTIALKDISQLEASARKTMNEVSATIILVGTGLTVFFYLFLGRVQKSLIDRTTQLAAASLEQTRLEAAKQMADSANQAKSEFLANMSHELRTPLNGILGYAQILQRSEPLTDRGRKGVSVIYQCGYHLLTLINDVLDLSKIEARKMELYPNNFHLPSFLEGLAEICRIRAEEKGIGFIYEPTELPPGIQADEKRLRQVLINLLGNAIKFTEKGSVTFLVEIDRTEQPEHFRARFSIKDTGVGMEADQLEQIFLPFEQVGSAKKQSEGTGLGLSISQKIVEMMGSCLQVQSQLGVGSTFYFEVELTEASNWAIASRTDMYGTVIGYQGAKRKILIVDDRWENRAVIVTLLEPIGFTMLEACNGREGLAKLAENPDLVITDIVMPIMDGFEMLEHLRQNPNYSTLPVIVSSASVFDLDRDKSIAAGGNSFLPKPVHAQTLLEQIQEQLQLEWIYESANPAEDRTVSKTSAEIVPPPIEVLQHLAQLVEDGDLFAVQEESLTLAEAQPQYAAFAQTANQLAENFQAQKLTAFIQKYLEINP